MSKRVNLAVSIVLGLICSALLFIVGVLAVKNYSPYFSINLSFNLSMQTKIELALNDGTYYVIYDNSPDADEDGIPFANVSNMQAITDEDGDIVENLITLGSVFANVFSIDVFNFKIGNYNTDGTLVATLNATASPQSNIISQTCNPPTGTSPITAYNGTTPASAVLDFQLEVLEKIAIQIDLDLVLTVTGS